MRLLLVAATALGRDEVDDGPPAGAYPLWVTATTLDFEVPRDTTLGPIHVWSSGDFRPLLEVRFVDMHNRLVSKFTMSADEFDTSEPTINNSNGPDNEEMARAVANHLRDHYRRVP